MQEGRRVVIPSSGFLYVLCIYAFIYFINETAIDTNGAGMIKANIRNADHSHVITTEEDLGDFMVPFSHFSNLGSTSLDQIGFQY